MKRDAIIATRSQRACPALGKDGAQGLTRPTPDRKSSYAFFQQITTRWMDNDAYRHVNNVVYYSFFDTTVNRFLIVNDLLDVEHSQIIGLVVESACTFFTPLSYPDDVVAGLRIGRIGSSSVQYEIGLFRNNETMASAQGRFVHVYVDRTHGRPMPLSNENRTALSSLLMAGESRTANR